MHLRLTHLSVVQWDVHKLVLRPCLWDITASVKITHALDGVTAHSCFHMCISSTDPGYACSAPGSSSWLQHMWIGPDTD